MSRIKTHLTLIAICILLTSAGSAMAQNGMNAPLSQYGIGLGSSPFNMPFASSMGGVVYTRSASNMINPFNPASYAAIQPTSFVFDMGLSIDMATLKDPTTSVYDAEGNVAYIAVAFPFTKWWKTSLGIIPLTDVNYSSVQTSTTAMGGKVKTLYEGVGGVSRMYWGNGFNIGKELSVGFNANFLYGNISRAITYDFTGSDTTYYMDSRREKNTYVRNLTFDFGLQYSHALNANYTLNVGLTATTPQTMNVTDSALVYTFVSNSSVDYVRDTIFPSANQSAGYKSTLKQPLSLGLGISLQRNNKWLVAFDATFAPWNGLQYVEDANHNIFGSTAIRYGENFTDDFRGALGFQRLGDKDAARYMRRVTYSAGVHYERGKMLLQLANSDQLQSLDEWGIGCGISLPMRKGRSVLNLSAAYSVFGSTDLLRRNCFTFGISIGSCETWFMKRKYN